MPKPYVWQSPVSGYRWFVELSRYSGDRHLGDPDGYETWGEAYAVAVASVLPLDGKVIEE